MSKWVIEVFVKNKRADGGEWLPLRPSGGKPYEWATQREAEIACPFPRWDRDGVRFVEIKGEER
jgi:hypothetical protein